MLYLLDANVLIDANRDYYPIERVPEFWDWLEHQGSLGRIKIPIEVYEEVREGTDTLAEWIRQDLQRERLVLQEQVDPSMVALVVQRGYAHDLTDEEVLKIGRDPFLIAYARASPQNRYVVTTEVSKPKRSRANRHLPDVCKEVGVMCCNTFELTRHLDFSTNWDR